MQPIYAGDVGAAIKVALSWPDAMGRTYELGGAATYSFKELMELMLADIGRRRALVPLPFQVAEALGAVGDLVAKIGLEPPITTDQVRMLKVDNVVAPGAAGLADLHISPTALEAILPTYLWKYRVGGQFAVQASPTASSI